LNSGYIYKAGRENKEERGYLAVLQYASFRVYSLTDFK
jgi:hypothetical protein